MKVFICDDDKSALGAIRTIIKKKIIIDNLDMEVISETCPITMMNQIKSDQTGIYFIDIDLNCEINGLELAQFIRERDINGFIIFVTAHTELALETYKYKVEPFDYVIKDTVDRIQIEIFEIMDAIFERIHKSENKSNIIPIRVFDKIMYFPEKDVDYFEAQGEHKLMICGTNYRTQFNGDLNKLILELPISFYRAHRSFIVNRLNIKLIRSSDLTVVFKDNETCRITRRKINELSKNNDFKKEN